MSYEIEVKYRSVDHQALVRRLESLGAEAVPSVQQEDAYLQHPSRDFARTNEAFRLRRVGDQNLITYKGPRQAGPTKTREEIEIAFTAGDAAYAALARLFNQLGFQPVATIRKTRSAFEVKFEGRRLEVALDISEGLGGFAEIETLAEDEADLPAAGAVLGLAQQLDLTEVEPRSYLRMALERRAVDPGAENPAVQT